MARKIIPRLSIYWWIHTVIWVTFCFVPSNTLLRFFFFFFFVLFCLLFVGQMSLPFEVCIFCFLRSRTQNNLFCHLLWTWGRSVKDATFSVACYWKTLVVNTDGTYPNIYCCLLLIQVSMQVIFDLFLLFLLRRRCLDFSVSKTQVRRFKTGHFDHSITFDYIRPCSASSPPVWFMSLVVSWPW